MANKLGVGIVGCGNISSIYCKNLKKFEHLNLLGCADIDMDKAHARAAEFDIAALEVDELLEHPEIALVVNLTIPNVHAEVSRDILKAGKHVYSEKPLATTSKDARAVLKRAKKNDLRVGGAPDTFLGGSWQTIRQLIDEGAIGEPIAAVGFMIGHGPERWHPNPDFFYQPGAGPLFDMAPYYLTTFINFFGAISRVSALAHASFPERVAADGHHIPVNTPTHVTAALEFENGVLANLLTTFDVWHSHLPRIEVYGSEGSLLAPDPNWFGGDIQIRGKDDADWQPVPVTRPYLDNWRGLGVADMARAIMQDDPDFRCNGKMTYHVVNVMRSILKSAAKGEAVEIESTCERPEPMPAQAKEPALESA